MKNKLCMADVEKIFREREPETVGKYRYFSVLLPLVEKDGELYVLYEVRAAKMKSRPGEVCFPGGAVEKGEHRKECAVRETMEELGLERDAIEIINEIDTLHTYSNFTMYCYLGKIDYEALCRAEINKDEVEEYFMLPLEEMLKLEPYVYEVDIAPVIGEDFPYDMLGLDNGYNWNHGISEVPIYRLGERTVWGLTARLTKNFLNAIRKTYEIYNK